MITLCYNNKRFKNVPESYNELSGKQLVGIAGLFARELDEEMAKLQALKILLNKSLLQFGLVAADAKQRMLPYVDWIFEKNKLTKQVLESYRGFYGPRGEFENLTLAEFHFCEVHYRELAIEKNDSALDKLVAVLYRKAKPFYNFKLDTAGDARRVFNANETPYFSRQISGWPIAVKLAIMFFYDGCRQHLLELYDEIFQGDSGEDNEEGMFGIIRGLSGDKYGDIDKVENMNIHTALLELTLQLKEAVELQAKSKTS